MRILISSLLGFLFLLTTANHGLKAQIWYVYFSDKPHNGQVEDDFDDKALERRTRLGIDFPQGSDYPVSSEYVSSVGELVDSVRFELRWLNAVTVEASLDQIVQVEELPFVRSVEPMEMMHGGVTGLGAIATLAEPEKKEIDTAKMERLVVLQRDMMELDLLIGKGLDGSGIRIAVLDAGFAGADKHPAFQHLHNQGKIVGTRDFYRKDDKVYHHGSHGTMVLSCLAGMYDQRNLGAATGAEFLLARTEHGLFERLKEEDCWLAAVEWADREGADMISSSLGYGSKRYTYADMDGKTTPVTKAALMAESKGILVVSSMGNEGNNKFFYLTAPGDAATVLTVGASFPMLRFPMPFSSHGPNAAGVIKPDVSGPGYVVAADKKGGFDFTSGTSFACPYVAGLVACVMQKYPDYSPKDIRMLVCAIGHLRPFYNYELGYGIPQAHLLFVEDHEVEPTFKTKMKGDSVRLIFDQTVVNRDTAKQRNGKPCFAHWQQPDGRLSGSASFLIKAKVGLVLPLKDEKGGELKIWFEDYIWPEEKIIPGE